MEFVLLILLCVGAVVGSSNITMSTVIDSIFDGYDKKLPPRFDSEDKQVQVTVNIFVISMYTIDESSMDFSMSFHLRERWVDERLSYDNSSNLTRLELDNSLFDNVWIPDVYILNEKSSNFHEVTVLNKMIHIYPDGTVQMVSRVTGVFSCEMYLYKYPFDKQQCYFEIESFGHDTEKMKFVWDNPALAFSSSLVFPQFDLVDNNSYNCEKDYYGIVYPCIGLEFVFQRTYNYHIIHVYVPSILIVFLSWISFWLDFKAVPARVTVGLLTVVTITTQSASARAHLPRVSYVKAIDVYMAACLTFVFFGIIEYAYVNVVTRVQSREQKYEPKHKDSDVVDETLAEDDRSPETPDQSKPAQKKALPCFSVIFERLSGIERARAVDKVSRVLFPALFAVFNVTYWTVYLLWDPQFGEKAF